MNRGKLTINAQIENAKDKAAMAVTAVVSIIIWLIVFL